MNKKEIENNDNKPAYHCTPAIINDNIGIIQYWEFRNRYLFMNYERGIITPIKNIEDVQKLTNEEFNKLYDERNIHEGTEREKKYGKVHEGWINIGTEGTTNKTGKWSMNFCREIASIKANIELQKELKTLGILKKTDLNTNHKDIVIKYHISDNSTYSKFCEKMFNEELSELDIIDIIIGYYNMPISWQDLKEDSEFGMSSDEMKFYLKHPRIPEIEPENSLDEFIKEKFTKKLKEFIQSRESYKENMSLYESINSLESGMNTELEMIGLLKKVINLYGQKKSLSEKDQIEVAKNKTDLQEYLEKVSIRKDIISLLNLYDGDKTKNLIQDYLKDIESKVAV